MNSIRPLLTLLTFFFFAFATNGSAAGANANARRPNVILVMANDQGSVDVGCYGAKDLVTPNLVVVRTISQACSTPRHRLQARRINRQYITPATVNVDRPTYAYAFNGVVTTNVHNVAFSNSYGA